MVVSENPAVTGLLQIKIEERLDGVEVRVAQSVAQVRGMLDESGADCFAAVIDLGSPGTENVELIDYMRSRNIPVVALTGAVNDILRGELLAKGVVDYIPNRNLDEFEQVAALVRRLKLNPLFGATVVGGSPENRETLERYLSGQGFSVDRQDAAQSFFEWLRAQPQLRVVLVEASEAGRGEDSEDELELIAKLRERFSRMSLVVIGICAEEESAQVARLLKAGANDVLRRPFSIEELHHRVMLNLDHAEQKRHLSEVANRDYLTGLFNRRYLFEAGAQIYANAKRGHVSLTLAMVDLDFFKSVNDLYGRQVGDLAIRHAADCLGEALRESDLLVRYGGGTFCVLLVNAQPESVMDVLEKLRRAVSDVPLQIQGHCLTLTVSVGATRDLGERLDDMLNTADLALFGAKTAGRDRVWIG